MIDGDIIGLMNSVWIAKSGVDAESQVQGLTAGAAVGTSIAPGTGIGAGVGAGIEAGARAGAYTQSSPGVSTGLGERVQPRFHVILDNYTKQSETTQPVRTTSAQGRSSCDEASAAEQAGAVAIGMQALEVPSSASQIETQPVRTPRPSAPMSPAQRPPAESGSVSAGATALHQPATQTVGSDRLGRSVESTGSASSDRGFDSVTSSRDVTPQPGRANEQLRSDRNVWGGEQGGDATTGFGRGEQVPTVAHPGSIVHYPPGAHQTSDVFGVRFWGFATGGGYGGADAGRSSGTIVVGAEDSTTGTLEVGGEFVVGSVDGDGSTGGSSTIGLAQQWPSAGSAVQETGAPTSMAGLVVGRPGAAMSGPGAAMSWPGVAAGELSLATGAVSMAAEGLDPVSDEVSVAAEGPKATSGGLDPAATRLSVVTDGLRAAGIGLEPLATGFGTVASGPGSGLGRLGSQVHALGLAAKMPNGPTAGLGGSARRLSGSASGPAGSVSGLAGTATRPDGLTAGPHGGPSGLGGYVATESLGQSSGAGSSAYGSSGRVTTPQEAGPENAAELAAEVASAGSALGTSTSGEALGERVSTASPDKASSALYSVVFGVDKTDGSDSAASDSSDEGQWTVRPGAEVESVAGRTRIGRHGVASEPTGASVEARQAQAGDRASATEASRAPEADARESSPTVRQSRSGYESWRGPTSQSAASEILSEVVEGEADPAAELEAAEVQNSHGASPGRRTAQVARDETKNSHVEDLVAVAASRRSVERLEGRTSGRQSDPVSRGSGAVDRGSDAARRRSVADSSEIGSEVETSLQVEDSPEALNRRRGDVGRLTDPAAQRVASRHDSSTRGLAGADDAEGASLTQSSAPTSQPDRPSEPSAGERPTQYRDPHRIIEQIVERARFTATGGRQVVTLQLRPETLGRVQVRLESIQDRLSAEVNVETRDVQRVLESQIGDLRQALKQQGVELHTVKITYSGGLGGDARNGQDRQDPGVRQWQGGQAVQSGSGQSANSGSGSEHSQDDRLYHYAASRSDGYVRVTLTTGDGRRVPAPSVKASSSTRGIDFRV